MTRRIYPLAFLLLAAGTLLSTSNGFAVQPGDLLVRFEDYDGPAQLAVRCDEAHKLRIEVEPKTETDRLVIRVELPETGRNAWPAADVEVRDGSGAAVSVRRGGIEWHKLLIPVPAVRNVYYVQAITPASDEPRRTAEQDRQLSGGANAINVSVAHWYDGRQAALSLRFDDSHPTHLTKAIPILRQHGFRGTFMVNPGTDEPGSRRRSMFQAHFAQWEEVARTGAHEFANHSAHHRGANGDVDMEAEIGEAAQAIWRLTAGKSRLLALNLGGGTQWITTRTLRYYLDKYHQFDASFGSLGMDDSYSNRVAAFRRHIDRHIEGRGWCRVHFHSIGKGFSTSEANFRAALDIAAKREAALWIAGMADIYKYQAERNGSSLSRVESNDREFAFRISCQSDSNLYDQPLTIEVTPPVSWPRDGIVVRDWQDQPVVIRKSQREGRTILRFDVAPRTSIYRVETETFESTDS